MCQWFMEIVQVQPPIAVVDVSIDGVWHVNQRRRAGSAPGTGDDGWLGGCLSGFVEGLCVYQLR